MEDFFKLKCQLLAHGCAIDRSCSFDGIFLKQIHLYSHSEQKPTKNLPEDFFIGEGDNRFIVRFRLNDSSPFQIIQSGDIYFLRKEGEILTEIHFLISPKFRQNMCKGVPISSVCSRLGNDTVGVVPSNYCFYFKDGKQCRFCELLPTHKKEVEFSSTLKAVDLISKSIASALESDPYLRHIAITSGNVKSYNWTAEYYCKIGEALQKKEIIDKVEDVDATLMPPEDFLLIDKLRASGFNKMYFPIEVYNYEMFHVICPGKKEFGYARILDALSYAVDVFGEGNVYTNLVYGIQSLNAELDPSSFDAQKENSLCNKALDDLLQKKVIPLFTIYHFGGYNSIGRIKLDSDLLFTFFKNWGRKVFESDLVKKEKNAVLFDRWSLANSLYNDGYWLAKNGAIVANGQ